jgi:AcrR family transcriptional regulator
MRIREHHALTLLESEFEFKYSRAVPRLQASTGQARAAQNLPSHTGQPPLSARGLRSRAALVRAARAVFERDGFLEARIVDICAEAGISTGSFYTYFKTKEDAAAAVMAEVHEETLHPRLKAIAGSDDPRAAIDAANRAYLRGYRRNARLMTLIEQVALIDERFLQLRLKRAHTFAQRNAAAIARLQARGLADPTLDPFGTAHAMNAMVSRMASLVFVYGLDMSFDALAEMLLQLWTNALQIPADSLPAAGARQR